MEKEELKWVEGYEGLYAISNMGRIFSFLNVEDKANIEGGIELKPALVKGYYHIGLYKGNVRKGYQVHRLVAKAFCKNTDNKKFIDHINTIRTDNRACNLRWCTVKENCNNPITKDKMRLHPCAIDFVKTRSKEIGQYDLDGNLIAVFNSASEARRSTGVSKSSIQDCARGKIRTGGGFIWKWLSEQKISSSNKRCNVINKRPVGQYDQEGNLIATYESTTAAAKAIGCKRDSIGSAARGQVKSSHGFAWRFLSDDKQEKRNIAIPRKERAIKQYDMNGNHIASYKSVTEASKATGIKVCNISRVARGDAKSTGGYIWEFISMPSVVVNTKKRQRMVGKYNNEGNLISSYESIVDAAKSVQGSSSNIGAAARGKVKSAYGYIWKYLDKEKQ